MECVLDGPVDVARCGIGPQIENPAATLPLVWLLGALPSRAAEMSDADVLRLKQFVDQQYEQREHLRRYAELERKLIQWTGRVDEARREAYERVLRHHDWHAEQSDDPRVRERARDQHTWLVAERDLIDHNRNIWNRHCPPQASSAFVRGMQALDAAGCVL